VNLYADTVKANYEEAVSAYFERLRIKCMQYQINYVPVDIQQSFDQVLTTYLVERRKY